MNLLSTLTIETLAAVDLENLLNSLTNFLGRIEHFQVQQNAEIINKFDCGYSLVELANFDNAYEEQPLCRYLRKHAQGKELTIQILVNIVEYLNSEEFQKFFDDSNRKKQQSLLKTLAELDAREAVEPIELELAQSGVEYWSEVVDCLSAARENTVLSAGERLSKLSEAWDVAVDYSGYLHINKAQFLKAIGLAPNQGRVDYETVVPFPVLVKEEIPVLDLEIALRSEDFNELAKLMANFKKSRSYQ